MRIEILNIPNYYCSYYILTLYQNSSLKFEKEGQFRKYDHRPLIIFRFAGKIYVIDNNDPVGFDVIEIVEHQSGQSDHPQIKHAIRFPDR